jgi:4-amino-4-deoxy-L-arabinose transferase-like glycosyltransferase
MVVGLALLALWALDRDIGWAKGLQWWWGLVACLALFGALGLVHHRRNRRRLLDGGHRRRPRALS